MEPKSEQSCGQSKQGSEQKFVLDGCKITIRYSSQKNPHRISEMKSLLLSAQFPPEKV